MKKFWAHQTIKACRLPIIKYIFNSQLQTTVHALPKWTTNQSCMLVIATPSVQPLKTGILLFSWTTFSFVLAYLPVTLLASKNPSVISYTVLNEFPLFIFLVVRKCSDKHHHTRFGNGCLGVAFKITNNKKKMQRLIKFVLKTFLPNTLSTPRFGHTYL